MAHARSIETVAMMFSPGSPICTTTGAVMHHGGIPSPLYASFLRSEEKRQLFLQEQAEKRHRARVHEIRAIEMHRQTQAKKAEEKPRVRAAMAMNQLSNRGRVNAKKREAEAGERDRQRQQHELNEKVRQRREAAAGRVRASREALVRQNLAARLEEKRKEMFALDEKARRLTNLQKEHAMKYAQAHVRLDEADPHWAQSDFRSTHWHASATY